MANALHDDIYPHTSQSAKQFLHFQLHFIMNYMEKTPRRSFFKKSKDGLTISAGLSVAASLLQSNSTKANKVTFEIEQKAATEKDFRQGVIGPAELSLATSQIAVDKASNKNAKEFAGFELEEAIAVTTVLKDLGTPVPPMDAKAQTTFDKIKNVKAGVEFDKAYIKAQLENHEFLRDLATDYLKNAAGKNTPAESQGRHLATLSLAVFKEHVAITKRIVGELGG